uniref:Cell proliferation regulating inhibitor of protein phosphatase 2A n=1 Tax=Neogobius melanostomus TaxID=47308 RepID=A0A8C6SUI8_9GOBI
MDMTTRLKCLLMAIQQYTESRTATMQPNFKRVSTLPPEQLLTPGQALPTECVSGLVDLAGNPNTSPALTSCIVSLLEQLASEGESRVLLHSSYSLTSTLASIIHSHSASRLFFQCLRVLQKLTYNTRVFQSINYFHELISFLMVNIQSLNDELITPCLGLMANLCRDNHSVQSYIKSLENVKPFYRTLINFLAHSSMTVVVFTLSILASLTMNEKVGEKVYISARIADYLTRYKHFSVCVSKVLGLLHSKDPEMGRKHGQGTDAEVKESGVALVQCLSSSVEGAEARTLQALQLLHELLEVRERTDSGTLLKTLELMSKLRQQVKDMVTSFYKMLQDQRIVTPLSLALTSHHRDSVQTALSLLFEATPLPEFPALILGECIAANNAYRQREAELSVKRVAVQECPTTRVNGSVLDSSTSSMHKMVSGLADKMQNGLALQEKPRDSLVSEVINVYEQKLSAFESKESRLQDLLEAKARALSQADRLIAQFRVQQAQAEVEARKLGCLLKGAERRREELQCELGNQVLEVDRCKSDIEELLKHNSRLQQDSEEHQTLKGAYNTLLNRLNESERLLKELQAAHVALTKQNDSLKKNQETLQLNNDRMAALVEERDEEIKSLHSDLQQKDSDIGLRLKEKEQERRDLEETVDVLRKELDKTQQARKDASIKASSLEQQRSQLELKLKQKEDELNKHSSMIAMIHSLSSGKMKNDSNVSL